MRLARSVRRNTRHVRGRSKRHLSCSGRSVRSDALGAHEKPLPWVPFLLTQAPYSLLGEALSVEEWHHTGTALGLITAATAQRRMIHDPKPRPQDPITPNRLGKNRGGRDMSAPAISGHQKLARRPTSSTAPARSSHRVRDVAQVVTMRLNACQLELDQKSASNTLL
jgi:hypothetical protein